MGDRLLGDYMDGVGPSTEDVTRAKRRDRERLKQVFAGAVCVPEEEQSEAAELLAENVVL